MLSKTDEKLDLEDLVGKRIYGLGLIEINPNLKHADHTLSPLKTNVIFFTVPRKIPTEADSYPVSYDDHAEGAISFMDYNLQWNHIKILGGSYLIKNEIRSLFPGARARTLIIPTPESECYVLGGTTGKRYDLKSGRELNGPRIVIGPRDTL